MYKARQEGSVASPPPEQECDSRLVLTLLPPTTTLAEYLQICRAVAIGFAMMGGIGYLVKLIHVRDLSDPAASSPTV